ncbi:MAG: M3 family oligoendopeptidase [Candidatus Eisenbacteria bacterium]|nr:M3 family oligoendopeptidase [Candidatus Eisenbacteria bacterium]
MPDAKGAVPRWDLSNIYAGLDSEDFLAATARVEADLKDLEAFIERNKIGRLKAAPKDVAGTGRVLDEAIERLNSLITLWRTLESYVYCVITTDSYNALARRRKSELEMLDVRFTKCYVRFEMWVGSLAPALDRIAAGATAARTHRAKLGDIAEHSRFRMEALLEDLAFELVVSGSAAAWKLHGAVTSQLKVPFEKDGKTTELPMTVIRNLANNPDESVRRRAYETELSAWASIREPVAYALNSVKGGAVTLAKRRGYESALHESLVQNKMDRETLDALFAAMRDSFPIFRRYFRSKARKLNKERLAWWDLMAPADGGSLSYSWDEAAAFIAEKFGRFSGELADFAAGAFRRRWIDAEPRAGKVGGAYCTRVPAVEESRILSNFDGSFDALGTLAHELGHAFHNHCQHGLPMLRRGAPMTLAETASIFCETIVLNAAFESASPEAQLAILENDLIGASQTIVDIYSRFIFESEVMKRREKAELSADEFCEIMLDAQRQTYGDGLDEKHLHPYMWLLKPHYYELDASFYNYPYAFGHLFGLGVYAIYLREGESFVPRYKDLLRSTGEGKAADLAARYGIDIRSRAFWDESLAVIGKRVERYCGMDGQAAPTPASPR